VRLIKNAKTPKHQKNKTKKKNKKKKKEFTNTNTSRGVYNIGHLPGSLVTQFPSSSGVKSN